MYAMGGRSSEGSRMLSECKKLDLSERKLPLNWDENPVRCWGSGGGGQSVTGGENCLHSVMVVNTVTGRWRKGPAM